MKKTYGKPLVSFESFAFSSNIAAGCGAINGIHRDSGCEAFGTHSDVNTCRFFNDGVMLFLDHCGGQTPQDGVGDLCYHVPTDSTRVFMS